jgi:hypothetical protein
MIDFILIDVGGSIWQIILNSANLINTLNTIVFSSISTGIPFVGSISVASMLFNPITFTLVFGNMLRKKLV